MRSKLRDRVCQHIEACLSLELLNLSGKSRIPAVKGMGVILVPFALRYGSNFVDEWMIR